MIDVLVDSGTAEMYRLEALGVRLVEAIIARAGLVGSTTAAPRMRAMGPGFDYRASSTLFGGRDGQGALRVALDTNVLIDYFEHGHTMWRGEAMAPHRGEYGEQLEALQLILAVWVVRDIEFVMLKESLLDSKHGKLPADLAKRNRMAWSEFCSALTHGPNHSNDTVAATPPLPPPQTDGSSRRDSPAGRGSTPRPRSTQ